MSALTLHYSAIDSCYTHANIYLLFFRDQPSPPMTPVLLIHWQRRVRWERKSTAPTGSKLATATICRKVASISTKFQRTKRLVARLASASSQIGLEKSSRSRLSLQLCSNPGDVRKASLNIQVLQALPVAPVLLLLLGTAPQSSWLAAIVRLQLTRQIKVMLPIRSIIPTLQHLQLRTSIFRLMPTTWLSSVHSIKVVNPSLEMVLLRTTNSVQLRTPLHHLYTMDLPPLHHLLTIDLSKPKTVVTLGAPLHRSSHPSADRTTWDSLQLVNKRTTRVPLHKR